MISTFRVTRRSGEPEKADPRLLALEMLERWKGIDLEWDTRLEPYPARDRALAKQLFSGTLRMRGKIDYYLNFFLRRRLSDLPQRVRNILRMAVFQLKFLDRIPDYAGVNEAVELSKRVSRGKYSGLVNGVLRRLLREWEKVTLPCAQEDPLSYLAVNYSHPKWMVKRYLTRFGFQFTESLLEANNTQAPLVLRSEEVLRGDESNTSRLPQALEEKGLKVRSGRYVPEALLVEGSDLRPSELPGFHEGLFYVQDEAAMLVAHLAAPVAGSLIFDFCSAPGGKTTWLARVTGKDTMVVASDLNRKRLARLEENLARLGLSNVHLLACDGRFPALRAEADLVLCDVPCTGTGVLRRKPELRWRLSMRDLVSLSRLQGEILSACADCLKPGGVLIYSTCSIEPEENREVVDSFLAGRTEFFLDRADKYLNRELVSQEGYLETFPNLHGIDGVFAARLVRKTMV